MFRKSITTLLFIFCFINYIHSQEQGQSFFPELENASVANGERLFVANCANCHEVCDQKLGPPLTDIMKKRPIPWLVNFIQNSSKVVNSGDKYAQHLYDAYNQMEMPSFTELDEKDVLDILKYIKEESDPNERDTIIKNTEEISALIDKARSQEYEKERGEVKYYQKEAKEQIPVDEASVLNGKGIFQQNCQNCHEICETKIGPALAGISKRRPLPWLLDFINDPVKVVKTKDNYSNYLISNYNFIMPGFDYISTEDKLDALAYIRSESSSEVSTSGINSQEIAESPEENKKKDSDEENFNSQKSDDEDISDTIFKSGFILAFILLFGAMAFFFIKYLRRNK
ncbi:MAG: c-type cytochrome [Bacteroidota bacterium]